MPPQTNVYVDAPKAGGDALADKGLIGFLKSHSASSRRWIARSTVRALGDGGSNVRRAARRPVWE